MSQEKERDNLKRKKNGSKFRRVARLTEETETDREREEAEVEVQVASEQHIR